MHSCKGKKDCPKDSQDCIYDRCYYKYFCRDDECMSNSNSTLIYNKDSKVKGLIVDVCTPEAIKSKACSTPACNSNDECFSKSCINNICMSNNSLPIIRCSNDYVRGIPTMKCKRKAYEHCEKDDECFSGYCTDEKFCNDSHNVSKKNITVLTYLLKLVFGFSCIILIYTAIYKIKIYEDEEKYNLTVKKLSSEKYSSNTQNENAFNEFSLKNKNNIEINEVDISDS
ncbi:hypothetical protein PIROE2DRAFT_16021 [Piromyces sp. E2]|nr:hypothetical protein PIROE2DRAFT_16021 [Piromyces sp. E2]|eukprot:OUM58643.1 hypothetical protein PIROE2DRAFT_16021 [Piromyces sp. E2]